MKIKYLKEILPDEKIDEKQILDFILKSRKIKNLKEFINPTSPLSINLSDFGKQYTKSFKKTLKLLKQIKEKKQMIVVYTDYDADGITGGAILWETLYLLGFKVMPYVPHRKLEGYGFSKAGLDAVKKLYDPTLIISVDHGIAAREKIAYAKSLGIKVIVTDHHLKPEKLPVAEAIFHIPELSGSGVSYFFAKEIFTNFGSESSNFHLLSSNFQSDYLALASIGTIADLVPLVGPSRSLVKYGLAAFSNLKRVGLKEIIKNAGISGRLITTYEVGFMIAPRINAVGRLEHAIEALRLLCTNDPKKARELAAKIGDTNRTRQDLVEQALKEAKKMVDNKKLIILVSNKWHEGIIGLIAAKIAEQYYRPTIVMTENNGFLKGSARSIPNFHITDFLRDLKKYLIDVGGHKGAAGFTMEKNNLNKFVMVAQNHATKKIKNKDLDEVIEADLKIPISLTSLKLAREIERLSPFGVGNPKPKFYCQVEIIDSKLFGKNNNHVRILVKKDSFPLELISFNNSELFHKLFRGIKTEIVFTLEVNRFRGSETLRGRVLATSHPKH